MISLDLIKNDTQAVKDMLAKRADNFNVENFLEIEEKRSKCQLDLENLQAKRNALAKTRDASSIEAAKALKKEITELSNLTTELTNQRNALWAKMPNMLDSRVPVGSSDLENVEIKKIGEKRNFTFKPLWHDELCTKLGILNITAGNKVAGSGFPYWIGDGALLQRALFNFATDVLISRGFKLVSSPLVAKKETFFGTGYLPFAGDQLYKIENEDLHLIGTSEQTLVGLHSNEIINLNNGPLQYTALTQCFRTEAGSYGKETKGVFRVHQFTKVEQIVFCKPEDSQKWHDFCLESSEIILQKLGIPYHVVNVCTGDLGSPASIKFDIEGYFPAYDGYRELTSDSNLLDFQTRRLNIRFKDENGKSVHPHTISATGITDRAMLAIIENNQNEDGSITIPDVLVPYMNSKKTISL